jgi:hypothetical protein
MSHYLSQFDRKDRKGLKDYRSDVQGNLWTKVRTSSYGATQIPHWSAGKPRTMHWALFLLHPHDYCPFGGEHYPIVSLGESWAFFRSMILCSMHAVDSATKRGYRRRCDAQHHRKLGGFLFILAFLGCC